MREKLSQHFTKNYLEIVPKNLWNRCLICSRRTKNNKEFVALNQKIFIKKIRKIKSICNFKWNYDRIKKLFIKQEMTKVKVCKCWQNPTNFLEEVKEHA